eukprot:433494_1
MFYGYQRLFGCDLWCILFIYIFVILDIEFSGNIGATREETTTNSYGTIQIDGKHPVIIKYQSKIIFTGIYFGKKSYYYSKHGIFLLNMFVVNVFYFIGYFSIINIKEMTKYWCSNAHNTI